MGILEELGEVIGKIIRITTENNKNKYEEAAKRAECLDDNRLLQEAKKEYDPARKMAYFTELQKRGYTKDSFE